MIVGAGAVGCYLGKKLGDETIVELRAKPFEKTCGGLFSRNIKKLDIDLCDSVENEVKGARFFSDNETFEVKTKDTQAYVVDRFAFQKTLIQDAENEGCKIEYGKSWTNDGYVLGADGAYSSLMNSCGIRRNYFNCYQMECELREKIDSEYVELHFGKFAPGFFGWVIPFDEKRVRIGLGCTKGNPADHFRTFSKKFKIAKATKPQAAMIPIYDGKKTVFGNKALVGDAAGQVKASSGGGVVIGCGCAEILATAVKKDNLQYYEKEWRKEYSGILNDHLLVRKVLNHVNYDRFLRLANEKDLGSLAERFGDMEDTRALKKALLSRPGMLLNFGKAFF